MAGYTSDEVQAAIDKFLLGAVSVPKTHLNSRDVVAARDDVYALLTTALLLRPNVYFYVIWLAKNKLEALRRAQKADLDILLDTTTNTSLTKQGRPVASTTELTNAHASLLNINAGMNAATGNRTRSLGPEVARFKQSIERFVSAALVPNVVDGVDVLQTAGEVRADIATRWAIILARDTQIQDLCAAIRDALASIGSAHLPEKAIQGIVSRLESRLVELTNSLPTDTSLSTHRAAMLDLLAMRTLLQQVSTFQLPMQRLAPAALDGTLLTGVGGTVPASITGTISGPFTVGPAVTLNLINGVTAVSIPLPDTSSLPVLGAPHTNRTECSDIIAAAAGYSAVQVTEDRTEYGGYAGITAAANTLNLVGFLNVPAIPAGTRVKIASVLDTSGSINSGYYRVVSSAVGQLVLDAPFVRTADAVWAFIFSSFLRVSAADALPGSGIAATASTGAALVGLPIAAQVKADFTSFAPSSSANFPLRGVEVGDVLSVNGSVVSITSSALNLLGTEAVPYFSGPQAYTIDSVRYLSWLTLVRAVELFLADTSLKGADFAITRILAGAAPTNLLGVAGPVQAYADAIDALISIQSYSIATERGVDNILQMLTEQGFDRAIELFTSLQIKEFFGMHADGASYATHLMRTAGDVTRQVAPVSRLAQSTLHVRPEVRIISTRRG